MMNFRRLMRRPSAEDYSLPHSNAAEVEKFGGQCPSWAALTAPKFDFRSSPESGLKSGVAPCPKSADIVAKVENRTTLKISRKSIFGLLCCCVAFQRHYGGP
jgi:hypothetical protein